jgi:hypothetical protein
MLVLLVAAIWTATAEPREARVVTWGDGAWCWFADPRAVHVVGRYDQTFVGWIDWRGDIVVGQDDARFGVFRAHAIARMAPDDHSSPALLVEPDYRLTVFYSGHNGRAMFYRTSLRPEDISAWGPARRVSVNIAGPDGYTYPNPVILPAEHDSLWLFWRGADFSADYATRTLDGRWGPARRLIHGRPPPVPFGPVPGVRPYVKVDTNGRDTIAIAFTDGHPREQLSSVYYAAYRDGSIWSASGRRIQPLSAGPIEPRATDIVYNAQQNGASAWVWDVAFDQASHPVIVYATFPSIFNHAYWYARWDGHRWTSHFLTSAGPSISPNGLEQQYSGGLALDHADPSIVYLSRQIGGSFAIERWHTDNAGQTWHTTMAEATPGVNNVRPVVPRGSDNGPIRLLWMRGNYGAYTDYATQVASTP